MLRVVHPAPAGPVPCPSKGRRSAALSLTADETRYLRAALRNAAAWRANLAARHWQRIESGDTDPTLTTIAKVACALQIPVYDLFTPVGR